MRRFALCLCLTLVVACGGDTQNEDGLNEENNANNTTENNDPGNNDPGNNDPGNNDPGNNDPGNNDPGNNDPGNNDPGNNDPGNNDPGNNDPNTCADIEARYTQALEGTQSCDSDAQCAIVSGQCGVGLGGCFEFVNDASVGDALASLGQEYSAADCTDGVCDCPPAPPAICLDGQCAAGPYCPDHEVGDVWMVDCNTCECTFDGVVCTEEACAPSCQEIESAYRDALAMASECRQHTDCAVLNGQCGVGLGGCYEAANQSLSQETLSALGQDFSEGGCTQAVCACAPPPAAICDEGRCALGPNCDGFQVGDTWQVDCNTCECTELGVVCTELLCNEGCRTDDECPDGFWCRDREDLQGKECVPFQEEGGVCGGFVPPFLQARCAPGMTCTDFPPLLPDAPGRCRARCEDNTSCSDDDYCSTNDACRDHGTCFHPLDCDIPENDYTRERCVGHGSCNGTTCEWVCEPAECRDFGVGDFQLWLGFCDRELGFGVVNGTCASVSGCDSLGLTLFRDLESCNNACGDR